MAFSLVPSMTSDPKVIIGIISVIFSLSTAVPYMHGMMRGTTKPHVFSWALWAFTGWVGCSAQVWDHAGAGAWATMTATFVCTLIFFWSLKIGEKRVTRVDWMMFLFGLAAIPAWLFTGTPLWSALIVGSIDIIAYGPTVRKSWRKPFDESLSLYVLAGIWEFLSVLAMQHYSIITTFSSASLLTCNLFFVPYVLIRRRLVNKHG